MKKKLFSFFMLILFLSTSFAAIVSYNENKKLIVSDVKNNLKSETGIIKECIVLSDKNRSLDYIIKDIKDKSNKRITIISRDGSVIGDSDKEGGILENHLKRPEVRDAFLIGEGFSVRYSDTIKTPYYYYASKFNLNNEEYVIRVAVKVDYVKYLQSTYLRSILITLIIGSIVSMLLAYIYINNITKPIMDLTSVATKIALGDYEKRININPGDEIGKLGHAFNLMAGRLQETISDLSDKKNKLISILTSMNDGVIVVDDNEKIILVNPAAKKIFNLEDAVEGKYFIETIRNTDIEDIIRNVTDEEVEVQLNYPVPKVLSIRVTRVLDNDNVNKKIGIMLFIRDVTKIKSLEKMRYDFVANVSHELKTPLTSIKGFSETLKSVDDKQTRDKFLDIINIEAERLSRLINDILTLSELENKDILLNIEKIDVIESIQEVISIMEPIAENKGISLIYKSSEKNVYINGDRDKFKQMIINLVDNAIKYTNNGGRVIVEIYIKNNNIIIKIIDSGIGIPEKYIPRLFERFYRVDKARSRQMGGTGLGLAIVKHIVKLLDGEIYVESSLGKGTTFTIKLTTCAN